MENKKNEKLTYQEFRRLLFNSIIVVPPIKVEVDKRLNWIINLSKMYK